MEDRRSQPSRLTTRRGSTTHTPTEDRHREMSDHIDGPRVLADPTIDLTDLFAFISPADSRRTVFIANVFPFAGETALFSNAASYNIAARRVRVAGMGDAASFKPDGPEIR